jgi:hypothetical protein
LLQHSLDEIYYYELKFDQKNSLSVLIRKRSMT